MEHHHQNLVERYMGRIVLIQTYGHRRFVGRAITANSEFMVLQNVVPLEEHDSSRWQDELIMNEVQDGVHSGYVETLIRLSHIESISTDDEDMPLIKHAEAKNRSTASDHATRDLSASPIGIVHAIEIHYHPSLHSMFFQRDSETIMTRIDKLRKELKTQLGFEIPKVRCLNGNNLDVDQYQIWIQGAAAGSGDLKTDRLFAIHPESGSSPFDYPLVKEPAFGLTGQWILPEDMPEAELAGFTVVDPYSVLVTHASETIQRMRHELLSYSSLERSLSQLQKIDDDLVSDFFRSPDHKQTLHRVLISLLEDHVWIGNLNKIAEAVSMGLADNLGQNSLMSLVRKHIARSILKPTLDSQGVGSALVLCDQLQQALHEEHEGLLTQWIDGIFSWLRENSSHLTEHRPWALIVPEHCRLLFSRRVTNLQLPLVVVSQQEAITVSTLYAEKTILHQEVQALLESTTRRSVRSTSSEDLF